MILVCFALLLFKAFTFILQPSFRFQLETKSLPSTKYCNDNHGNPQAEDELHIAIAHWIAAHCLPIYMAEDALFK